MMDDTKDQDGRSPASQGRAATPAGPSQQAVSGIAGIPNAVRSARDILTEQLEYMDGLSRGQRVTETSNALRAVETAQREALEVAAVECDLAMARHAGHADYVSKGAWLMAEMLGRLIRIHAQGIEAAIAGETGSEADGLDAKHESPVGKADAPNETNVSLARGES